MTSASLTPLFLSYRHQAVLRLLRPHQWVKNTFVFVPTLFSGRVFDPSVLGRTFVVFLAFCAASSAVYAFNDVMDVDTDRRHPKKRLRPVASRKLSARAASRIALALAASALGAAFVIDRAVFAIVALYLVLSFAYSMVLKRLSILDVLVIAIGFVLRMLAGAAVSTVPPSHWILLTTFFLSLFLGFSKRRSELANANGNGALQRPVLQHYTIAMLDPLIVGLMGMTILSYSLYTVSDYAIERFRTDALVYTVPFIVYGLLRYFQMLVVCREGEDPSVILLKDRPIWICILLWGLLCAWIVYRGGFWR